MNSIAAIKDKISEGKDLAQRYGEQELEHLQLKVFYQLAAYSSGTAKKVVLGTLSLIAMIFGSLALALYLGDITGSTSLGFLYVAGIYVLLVAIAYLLRKKIEKYVINELSHNFFRS